MHLDSNRVILFFKNACFSPKCRHFPPTETNQQTCCGRWPSYLAVVGLFIYFRLFNYYWKMSAK